MLTGYAKRHRSRYTVISPFQKYNPQENVHKLLQYMEMYVGQSEVAFVAGSLGAVYAAWIREIWLKKIKRNIKMVLINPVVQPEGMVYRYIGRVYYNRYTGERYVIQERDAAQLCALGRVPVSYKQDILVLLQKGDEVLNYQRAVEHYQGVHMHIEANGSHRYTDFNKVIPDIFTFLDSA